MVMLIAVGIIASLAATIFTVFNYESRTVAAQTGNVIDECESVCDQILEKNYMNDTNSDVINSKLDILSTVYGRVLVINSDFKIIKDTYGLSEGKTDITPQVMDCYKQKEVQSVYDGNASFILITIPIKEDSSEVVSGIMAVAVPSTDITENLRILRERGIIIFVIMAILCVIAGWFFSKLMVKPLHRVTKGIEDITDGYRTDKLDVPDCTETEQVADAFNRMLARIRTMDESRQEFVSNVSHELKTPLTSMKVLADSLLSQPEVPNELYHEFMQDLSAEIDRETNIINDLLTMVKMDKKNTELQVDDVVISRMIRDVIERLQPIADRRGISLSLDVHKEITAEIDEVKLSLAFTNLIENGIKYNVDNGWVRVSLTADSKYFYVTVVDSGIGISDEDKEKIFERFYRADKSHSTEIEGTGLGLAITKTAIILHRGAIKVSGQPGEGTTFQVRIPLKYHFKEEARKKHEKK